MAQAFDRRSPAAGTNSVSDEEAGVPLDSPCRRHEQRGLATHALGATEHRLLDVLCGIEVDRDREAEFAAAVRSVRVVDDEWRALSARIAPALEQLTEADLAALRRHPHRGEISGLEMLIVVARHMGEHAGQAELTRDLALAAARG